MNLWVDRNIFRTEEKRIEHSTQVTVKAPLKAWTLSEL